MVAETPNGEHVAMPVNDESVEMMQCEPITTAIERDVCVEDVEFAKDSTSSEFEVLECSNGMCHVRFADGSEAYCLTKRY